MVSEPKKTLAEKLASVMAEVERIPKRGYNEFHRYNYVMEADLVAAIRPGLAREGVIILPSVVDETLDLGAIQERTGVSHLSRLMVEYTITDGNETLKFRIPGYGTDRGDKGVYKALTGSVKYALMKLFLVDTGDDPERDSPGAEPTEVTISGSDVAGIEKGGRSKKITRYQLQRIIATMREKGMNRSDLLELIAEANGVELEMPEDDTVAQETILNFLRDLDAEDAGVLLTKMEAWTEHADA